MQSFIARNKPKVPSRESSGNLSGMRTAPSRASSGNLNGMRKTPSRSSSGDLIGMRSTPSRSSSGNLDGMRTKKKKPRVEEINGILWQLDENGNPVKKVKKKSKPGDPQQISQHSISASRHSNVKEIDGILWQLDDGGNPIKKLRRKGSARPDNSRQEPLSAMELAKARRRAQSQAPSLRGRRSRIDGGDQRLRALSLGRPRQQPGEYIDDKGRRVIIEEDGNKIVFDKNGKRLRPKKKNIPPPIPAEAPPPTRGRPSLDHGIDFMTSSIRPDGNFDDIWSGKAATPSDSPQQQQRNETGIQSSPQQTRDAPAQEPPAQAMDSNAITSNQGQNSLANQEHADLIQKLADYGKENRELKMQLLAAQDEVRDLTQINQKEKSKNVKATTEMLQLKADFQQASDQKHNLELKIKNLEAQLTEKEELFRKLENSPQHNTNEDGFDVVIGGPNGGKKGTNGKNGAKDAGDHLVSQISDLMAENDALLDKLEFEKTASAHEMKKKEEQILFLNEELKKLREENDMLFRGEAEKDPLMAKLFQQKKDLEEKLEQTKEVMNIRSQGLQEMIDGLQKTNADLKKDLEKATLEIKDGDDDEIRRAKEMAKAVAKHGTRNTQQVRRANNKLSNGAGSKHEQQQGFGFGLNKLSALAARK